MSQVAIAEAGHVLRVLADHMRRPALVFRRRLLFERSLEIVPPRVAAAVDVHFDFEDPGGDAEQVVLGRVTSSNQSESTVYRMRVRFDRGGIARLVPLVDVPVRSAFIYGCETEPTYRGRGIYAAALTQAMEHLRHAGFERAYIRVDPGNAASIRGIEKSGFHLRGVVYHASIFGFDLRPRFRPACGGEVGGRPRSHG